MQSASFQDQETCFFSSFPKQTTDLELYSCTIMPVTIYNPAHDTGKKLQSYI